MPDNTQLNSMTGGDVVSTESLGGNPEIKMQRVKIVTGQKGTDGGDVETGNPLPVGGAAADQASAAGNPVPVGGIYRSSPPTYTNNQRAALHTDVNGNTRMTLGTKLASLIGGIENDSLIAHAGRRADSWQATINFAANTAQMLKEKVSNKSIYLTDLLIISDGGAACNLKVQDDAGSPEVLVEAIYLPASVIHLPLHFNTPIEVATGQDLDVICSSATPNITVLGSGYVI